MGTGWVVERRREGRGRKLVFIDSYIPFTCVVLFNLQLAV